MARLRATKLTGAGALGTGEGERVFILTPAAAAATCDIKENGTGGTVVMSLAAPANGGSVQVGPVLIKDPYLSALGGAGASVTVLQ